MGGEKFPVRFRTASIGGSPPRGRGKAHGFLAEVDAFGDHPRVGGEKHIANFDDENGKGSPPRGRGKVRCPGRRSAKRRITPAWAGKRRSWRRSSAASRDHPRVGGEKSPSMTFSHCAMGSPPRGRGKARRRRYDRYDEGITPAWAGKRLKRSHRSGIFISGPIPFHSVLHRPAGSGGSRAGRDGSLAGQPQNAGPA